MPKFNPIFTFSKINLKLTKKSSRFIFSNYFIKKLLEFYIVSSLELYRYNSASRKRFQAFFTFITLNLHPYLQFTLLSKTFFA